MNDTENQAARKDLSRIMAKEAYKLIAPTEANFDRIFDKALEVARLLDELENPEEGYSVLAVALGIGMINIPPILGLREGTTTAVALIGIKTADFFTKKFDETKEAEEASQDEAKKYGLRDYAEPEVLTS